jgi:hypothetical protein
MATTSNGAGITSSISLPFSDKPGISISYPFGAETPPPINVLACLQCWRDKGYTVELCSDLNGSWRVKATHTSVPVGTGAMHLEFWTAPHASIEGAVAAALEVLQP